MITDINTVKELLARYYRGESTQDDEHALQQFFAGDAVPPELEADRRVFAMVSSAKAPAWLAGAVERQVDRRVRRRVFGRRLLAAAASLAVAVAVAVPMLSPARQADSDMSPEEVRRHTEMALNILVGNVGKGCNAIEHSGRVAVHATEEAMESIRKI